MTRNHATSKNKLVLNRGFTNVAAEIQAYGTLNHLLSLELESVRLEVTEQLNQCYACRGTMRFFWSSLCLSWTLIAFVSLSAYQAGAVGTFIPQA